MKVWPASPTHEEGSSYNNTQPSLSYSRPMDPWTAAATQASAKQAAHGREEWKDSSPFI